MSDLLDELTAQDLQANNARKVIDEEYSSFDDSGEWFEFRIAGNEDRLSDKVALSLSVMMCHMFFLHRASSNRTTSNTSTMMNRRESYTTITMLSE